LTIAVVIHSVAFLRRPGIDVRIAVVAVLTRGAADAVAIAVVVRAAAGDDCPARVDRTGAQLVVFRSRSLGLGRCRAEEKYIKLNAVPTPARRHEPM